MSYFVNLRAGDYGAVCEPYVLAGDVLADPPGMVSTPYEVLPNLVRDKNVLLSTHGFNVNYVDGLRALGRLEAVTGPTSSEAVFGVLWPGDWAIPAINYPFEDRIAVHAGRLLGAFCNRWFSGAQSLSFVSHSLGARVVLEAVAALKRPARSLCITAGAIGADCLGAQYKAAAKNCERVVTLSSREDLVLALAFPIGDLIADILDLDHKPFQRALGRRGPEKPFGPPITASQIPDASDYDHGDYLPPSSLKQPVPDPDPAAKWPAAAAFMARAFRGQRQTWPL
ncbi:MAG: alpha/beta hydrolase [Caulobacteraceae bacterium]|nr:alpha/beta hydrolase [Caulobacteraceae bacterium]